MSSRLLTAEFVDSRRGRIFLLARTPPGFSGRCVLVVAPFAEEMNKSRRMITELGERLVAQGLGLVIVDFYGTGDSEGDFADTDCETWLADLAATVEWMRKRGWVVDSLLGLRLGCTVAAKFALTQPSPPRNTVLWQPVLDGARALDQFLRLRVAASLMQDQKETAADLKAEFSAGRSLEVAGYALSPALATQMEQLKFPDVPAAALGAVHWFEILRAPDASVPLPARKCIDRLSGAGSAVTLHSCVGEPFWASTEIVCLPEVLDRTANVLGEARA